MLCQLCDTATRGVCGDVWMCVTEHSLHRGVHHNLSCISGTFVCWIGICCGGALFSPFLSFYAVWCLRAISNRLDKLFAKEAKRVRSSDGSEVEELRILWTGLSKDAGALWFSYQAHHSLRRSCSGRPSSSMELVWLFPMISYGMIERDRERGEETTRET